MAEQNLDVFPAGHAAPEVRNLVELEGKTFGGGERLERHSRPAVPLRKLRPLDRLSLVVEPCELVTQPISSVPRFRIPFEHVPDGDIRLAALKIEDRQIPLSQAGSQAFGRVAGEVRVYGAAVQARRNARIARVLGHDRDRFSRQRVDPQQGNPRVDQADVVRLRSEVFLALEEGRPVGAAPLPVILQLGKRPFRIAQARRPPRLRRVRARR